METEQARHQAFEEACGGPQRAFALLHLWQDTHPIYPPFISEARKNEIRVIAFRKKAAARGYSQKQINMFLSLQGFSH